MTHDLIILGSGPAGCTAALYAARAGLKPLVLEGSQPGGQLTQTTDIENFPGLEKPVNGYDLVVSMRRQAERFGAVFEMDEAVGADFSGPVKKVETMVAGTLEARAVILATGASARWLGLPAEQALIGRGVSGCATCDGAFFRGKEVAVVGGGDVACEDALFLARLCSKVWLIHRRDALRASKVMADRVLASAVIEPIWDTVVDDVLDPAAGTVTAVRPTPSFSRAPSTSTPAATWPCATACVPLPRASSPPAMSWTPTTSRPSSLPVPAPRPPSRPNGTSSADAEGKLGGLEAWCALRALGRTTKLPNIQTSKLPPIVLIYCCRPDGPEPTIRQTHDQS